MDEKAAFMVMYPDEGKGGEGNRPPVLIIGLPDVAMRKMQEGLENSFDMTKLGIPVQIVLLGGGTHDQIMEKFKAIGAASGRPIQDDRRHDFGITLPTLKEG